MSTITFSRIAGEAKRRRNDPEGLREWLRDVGAPFELAVGQTPYDLERMAKREAQRERTEKQTKGTIELDRAWSSAMQDQLDNGCVAPDLIERIARASGAPSLLIISDEVDDRFLHVNRSQLADLVRAVRSFPWSEWQITIEGIRVTWINRTGRKGAVRLGRANASRWESEKHARLVLRASTECAA